MKAIRYPYDQVTTVEAENGPGEPETSGLAMVKDHVHVDTPPAVEKVASVRLYVVVPTVIVDHPELDCVPLIIRMTLRS
jgi:hypothetical protein